MNQLAQPLFLTPTAKIAARLGFWLAILTTVTTTVALCIAVTTLPISGPFCPSHCVTYPYENETVVDHVPHDYLWMYPGLLMAPLVLMLMVCIHHAAAAEKKLFSQSAVIFAAIYAAVISVDYYIQIAVIQPSLLRGEFEGVALISQYNPHSIFIALEDLGYLLLGIAFLLMAPVFPPRDRLARALRWLLGGSGLLVVVAFLLYHVIYGHQLEYRFEVLVIALDWTVLIVAGLLLAFWFKRTAALNERDGPSALQTGTTRIHAR